jgi:site-specific DNA-methyltransferase (adenine-specific)
MSELQVVRPPDVLEVIADLSNDEVFTPPKIANDVLDLLPQEVWSDKSLRWLDPACKTGVFLREITRRLLVGLKEQFPDEATCLAHILTNMVFGAAVTELTALMARRTLYCSKDAAGDLSAVQMGSEAGNLWFGRVEHAYDDQGRCTECGASQAQMERENRDNYAYAFIHRDGHKKLEEAMDMRFDVVVGNPPYQMESDGNTRTLPLYHLFVDQARALKPRYISMIVPARWIAGGLGLTEFRASMLNDKSIRRFVDYPDASEVFPGVDIKGGICYFLWDRDSQGQCKAVMIRAGETTGPKVRNLGEFDVLVRDVRALEILQKVRSRNERTMTEIVSGKRPFGFTTNTSAATTKPTADSVRLYRSGGSAWVARSNVELNAQWVDEWKVLTPQAGPGNSGGHVLPDMVLGKPLISEPGSCCTETYIVVGPLKSKKEAESLASYMTTRFFRFLVSLRKVSQHAPRGTYMWVPQQSWDRTWTDEELYQKYQVTADEQVYIAEMIKEMPA